MVVKKNNYLGIVLLIFMVFHMDKTYAQEGISYKAFGYNEGLHRLTIYSAVTDKEGFLWVASNKGLLRCDGNSIDFFKHQPEHTSSVLSDNNVDLLINSKEELWVCSGIGLSKYNVEGNYFQNYIPDSLIQVQSGDTYFCIHEDTLRRIWMGGHNGITMFDTRTNKFSKNNDWLTYAKKEGIVKTEIRNSSILNIIDKDSDELWLLSVYGLFSVNVNTNKYNYYPYHNVTDYWAYNIAYVDADGSLWLTSYDNDFYCYQPQTQKWEKHFWPADKDENPSQVTSITSYNNGLLLLATSNGFYSYDKISKKSQPIVDEKYPGRLPKEQMRILYSINDNMYLTNDKASPTIYWFNEKNIPKNKRIKKYKASTINRIFIKHDQRELLYGDWNENKTYRYLINEELCMEFEDRRKNKIKGGFQKYQYFNDTLSFIVTDSHLYRYFEGQNVLYDIKLPPEVKSLSSLRNIVKDNNNRFYVRDRVFGLLMINDSFKEANVFDKNFNEGRDQYGCLYFDSLSNSLWLSVDNKGVIIIHLQNKTYQHLPLNSRPYFKMASITDINGDDKGNIFLNVLNNGMIRINSLKLVPEFIPVIKNSSSNKTIYGTFYKNKYFFTTDAALCSYNLNTNEVRCHEVAYDNESFLGNQLYQSKPGELLYFKGPEHYGLIDLNALDKNNNTGKIYIKDIQVKGQSLKPKDLKYLSYKDNDLLIKFGYLQKEIVCEIGLQYRINKGHWQLFNNNFNLQLSNLSPNTYSIEVCDIFQDNQIFELTFEIKEAWWKHWSLLFGIFSVLVLLFAAYFKRRIKSIERREASKRELQKKISRVEIAAIRAQLNPHFVFNCLNSINRYILVNETETASVYLTKFSRLIRIVLDNSREEVISLDRELEALKIYIAIENMRFQHAFDYQIRIKDGLHLSDYNVPPLLIQPYVENAIWHGLIHKKEKGVLKIIIDKREEALIIVVEDNGIGRDKAKELNSKAMDDRKSYGISLNSERLSLMNQLNDTDNKIIVEDLHDLNDHPTGTRVTITIH